eukprot:CAMPEP_0116105402 /NCGR_PEP_ID=MMETSP0327-20121206/15013_1 /TAXON_ID=44447 /ORGANISM="Pseudo-nitzschia delicatissima, Strain B596" /LENGTH=154 /DNA_ID=CAMNT_0003597805 /DNA_START=114 /DNA_END=578 /DNA_ORIENTATION=-
MKVSKTRIARKPTSRKRRRGERIVQFSESTAANNGNSFLSAEEIQNTWYSRDEEQSFKQDAIKALCDYRRKSQYSNIGIIESAPRGLERHSKERRVHKKEFVRLIVIAHKKGFDANVIAAFSEEKSRWNMELASTQASIDQIEVLLEEDSCKFM